MVLRLDGERKKCLPEGEGGRQPQVLPGRGAAPPTRQNRTKAARSLTGAQPELSARDGEETGAGQAETSTQLLDV